MKLTYSRQSSEKSRSGRTNRHSRVDVEVRLPRPTVLKAIKTFMPHFLHEAGDLRGSVTFESITLRSESQPIIAEVRNTGTTGATSQPNHTLVTA